MERIEIVGQYLADMEQTRSEAARKERLFLLLNQLFGHTETGGAALREMTLGAERAIMNIPVAHRSEYGRADTLYKNVIIEFEKDLTKTLAHAKDQLAEYLGGVWRSGEPFNYVLIATDCQKWQIYAPRYKDFLAQDQKLAHEYELVEKESFELTPENLDEYYFFLDRTLFRNEKLQATLERIQDDFGQTSRTFITSLGVLRAHYAKVFEDQHLKTAFQQWESFLTIAYGKFHATHDVFLIHTYLSIVSKFLAYSMMRPSNQYISDDRFLNILNGKEFENLHIDNFCDNDFYDWVSDQRYFNGLKEAFRIISLQLSNYEFDEINEDILKGVYQELIDVETRHSLGEYYTPDWLCERLVDHFPITKETKWLDPSCGSGSFLLAILRKVRNEFPDIQAHELAETVTGIDIHPLSVQIAKTTLLLAIGREQIFKARNPVPLRIYLANTLYMPKDSTDLFGQTFKVEIDGKKYEIDNVAFDKPHFFDSMIGYCEKVADEYKSVPFTPQIEKSIIEALEVRFQRYKGSRLVEQFYQIFLALKEAKSKDRDGIWKFILINNYKPIFLKERFDYVIGNPPWLSFNSVERKDYQEVLRDLAHRYNVAPEEHLITQLEIASIFMSHSAAYFLKNGMNTQNRIAFVLPRSFISADQHDNIRTGKAYGYKLLEIWDMKNVTNLFNVPSCVLIGQKKSIDLISKNENINGYVVSGRIKKHYSNWEKANSLLNFKPVVWNVSKLGKRSAFSTQAISIESKVNFYNKRFFNGATIFPRNFYFVKSLNIPLDDLHDRILHIVTNDDLEDNLKKPWKDFKLKNYVNSKYLFLTALARNIVPFCLIDPLLVHLPIRILEDKSIKLLSSEDVLRSGDIESLQWFNQVEKIWNENKTEKNANINASNYLNWQQKLTKQNYLFKFIVIYSAHGKDANALVFENSTTPIPFVVENASFYFYTNNFEEANYVCMYLNANFPNLLIKDFQATGLFGPRSIHKKILEIPFPEYDEKNEDHRRLACLGKTCAHKATQIAAEWPRPVEGVKLGQLRLAIRAALQTELEEADEILKKVCGA